MKTILLTTLLLINSQLFSQDNRTKQIDSIFSALYAGGQFSGSVLIAENGKPLYAKSFGAANIATGEPNNENSQFLLASVSKQFTAFAILLLKINLDDNIQKYIPELPYNDISIRQLMNHSSGIPDYISLMEQKWDKNRYATNRDMLNMLVQYHPDPRFTPGLKYEYSNTGYALLALVIEKVSGKTFQQYMEEQVFKPLGLNRTIVYTRRIRPQTVTNYALGYVYNDSTGQFVLPDIDQKWRNELWEDGILGEDGISSTVQDMLTWEQGLYHNKLLSSASAKAIFTPGTVQSGETDYGFGWHIKTFPPYGKIAFHSGGWPGYMAYIERHMDSNKTIIILRNKFTPQTRVPIDKLRSILYSSNQNKDSQ